VKAALPLLRNEVENENISPTAAAGSLLAFLQQTESK
jgi:hypothetical protein